MRFLMMCAVVALVTLVGASCGDAHSSVRVGTPGSLPPSTGCLERTLPCAGPPITAASGMTVPVMDPARHDDSQVDATIDGLSSTTTTATLPRTS